MAYMNAFIPVLREKTRAEISYKCWRLGGYAIMISGAYLAISLYIKIAHFLLSFAQSF